MINTLIKKGEKLLFQDSCCLQRDQFNHLSSMLDQVNIPVVTGLSSSTSSRTTVIQKHRDHMEDKYSVMENCGCLLLVDVLITHNLLWGTFSVHPGHVSSADIIPPWLIETSITSEVELWHSDDFSINHVPPDRINTSLGPWATSFNNSVDNLFVEMFFIVPQF